ncbi:carbohydrate porin [Methylocapsa palsarum]|uniref:Porin n=1 Tax=Methylocapsa palsarum TaxID=1612308 RepID=A0A1I3Z193_9HYPH|nr:carbohydrate porin [Methylocapsa palsarum]SFK37868.1 porin [Methylocapsa palsarum]
MAWPTVGGYNTDTSLIIMQKFCESVTFTFGKFNMLDQAAKTPIRGGGGYDEFMNITPTAPVTGIIPAYIVGANLTVRTDPAIFSLYVYDPRNAQIPAVISHPFSNGITFNGSVTVPVTIAGLNGYQGVKAVYSTQNGLDLGDIPQLFLPPQAALQPNIKNNRWFLNYEFEQYFYQNPTDPKQGWGPFGYISVSDGNPNPIKNTYFFGIAGSSFLPSREIDRWGVMYFRNNISVDLKESLAFFRIGLGDERGWEVFYNFAATPWFRVTADAQFLEPALAGGQRAVFLGLRSQIKF